MQNRLTQTKSGFLMIKPKERPKPEIPRENKSFFIIKKLKNKIVYKQEISEELFREVTSNIQLKIITTKKLK